MKNTVQKIFISLLVVISYLLVVVSPINAQEKQVNISSANSDVPQNLHTYTQSVMIEVMASLTCQLVGIDPVNPQQKCLGVDRKTNKIGFVENGSGLVGVTTNLMGMLYTPPIHAADYARYLSQNFGIAKPVYAQGYGAGFQSISPLIGIWSSFRNIVYLLFVIVFVIIGLTIMLRIKIDPRTVMSIENQIPKIIISLLLVTFSFAIAGFLIDIMYLFIYLSINIISPADASKLSLDSNVFGFANSVFKQGDANMGFLTLVFTPARVVSESITNALTASKLAAGIEVAAGAIFAAVINPIFGIILAVFGVVKMVCSFNQNASLCVYAGNAVGNADAFILGFLGGLLAFLIFAIALLWALIRILFALLNAYIFILLDIVLAPFWILAGMMPGSTYGFGGWLRDLMANLMAFPLTIILFLLGKRLMEEMGTIPVGSPQFSPPLLGAPQTQGALGAFVGLGVVLLTPQAVQMMRDAFKSPQFKYTAAIGQAIGMGIGVPQRVVKNAVGITLTPYYKQGAKGQELHYPAGAIGRVLKQLIG